MNLTKFENCNAYKNAVYIDTYSNVTPCCYFKHKLPLNSLKDWSTYKSKLTEFDIESGCKHCIDLENNGSTVSHRLNFSRVNNLQIDICVDNLCNLKCTTCNVKASSQWIKDAVTLNLIKADEQKIYTRLSEQGTIKLEICKKIIEESQLPIAITFYGGEPTINPAVINFVNWLANLPNSKTISIGFITNVTTLFPNLDYYFTKFNGITIGASIDGIGEQNDYLRYGSDWNNLKNNLIHYSSVSDNYKNNYHFYVHLTLSLMNVYYFYEFCKWCNDNLINCTIKMTKLIQPVCYTLDLLTYENKLKIYNRNIELINQITPKGVTNLNEIKKEYETSVLTNAKNQEYNIDSALIFLKNLDNIRQTNFEKTFTEIYEILSSQK